MRGAKPHVERHEQVKIRAIVAPIPYAKTVQMLKRAALAREEEIGQPSAQATYG